MDRRREIERCFGWVPPPSTVVTLKTTDNRSQQVKRIERFGNADKLCNGGLEGKQDGYKLKDLFHESYRKEKEEISAPLRLEVNGIETRQKDKESRYRRKLANSNDERALILEENIEASAVKVTESGIDMFTDEYFESRLPIQDDFYANPPDQRPTRKEAGSEHYQIGRQPVDAGNLMRSRKISEFNPSQKFLSLSFQNDEHFDVEASDKNMSDLGAAYLKRMDPDELMQNGEQHRTTTEFSNEMRENDNGKSDGKMKRGFEDRQQMRQRKNGASKKALVHLNATDKHETPFTRKRSVFVQNDIDSNPIDVQEILSRKKSTASIKEKFLSMSIEKDNDVNAFNDTGTNLMTPHGGFYAKRVANRK